MVKFLPNNVQTKLCDPVVAAAVEWIDWCATAENYGCYPAQEEATDEKNVDIQELIDSLNVLSSNQETIYNQMNESFSIILQNISELNELYHGSVNAEYQVEEPIIDEREQQRLELQSQIEELQYQMENL